MRKVQIPQQYFEALVGRMDENLKALERVFRVPVSARGSEIFIDGDDATASQVEQLIRKLFDLLESGFFITSGDIKTAAALYEQYPEFDLKKFFLSSKIIPSSKKQVFPKSFNQKKIYRIDAVLRSCFCSRARRDRKNISCHGDGFGGIDQ